MFAEMILPLQLARLGLLVWTSSGGRTHLLDTIGTVKRINHDICQ